VIVGVEEQGGGRHSVRFAGEECGVVIEDYKKNKRKVRRGLGAQGVVGAGWRVEEVLGMYGAVLL
jgi:hypothetical protein